MRNKFHRYINSTVGVRLGFAKHHRVKTKEKTKTKNARKTKNTKKRGRPELIWIPVPLKRAKEFQRLFTTYRKYAEAHKEILARLSKITTDKGLVIRAVSVRRAARPEDIQLGLGPPKNKSKNQV